MEETAITLVAGTGLAAALAFLVRQVGHHVPGIVDALRRWTEARREQTKAEHVTSRTVEAFREQLFERVARLEVQVGNLTEQNASLIVERDESRRERGECREELNAVERRLSSLLTGLATVRDEIAGSHDPQIRALATLLAGLFAQLPPSHRPRGAAEIREALHEDDTGRRKMPTLPLPKEEEPT